MNTGIAPHRCCVLISVSVNLSEFCWLRNEREHPKKVLLWTNGENEKQHWSCRVVIYNVIYDSIISYTSTLLYRVIHLHTSFSLKDDRLLPPLFFRNFASTLRHYIKSRFYLKTTSPFFTNFFLGWWYEEMNLLPSRIAQRKKNKWKNSIISYFLLFQTEKKVVETFRT